MSLRTKLIAPAALAVLAARGSAQVPVGPALPAAPGVAAATGMPVPTVWDKLGISKKAKEECLRKLCGTPIGQLLNNSTAPLQALSGGLLPPFCPIMPSAADLAKEGAEGAAAKIKADEANAKARAAAVRFLATVDCHYWPEAEGALIGALRGDRNECVRFEAARALGSGCCCTKKTIEALNIVVSCSDRDGAPKETSARVHSAAQAALDHCLACFSDAKPATTPVVPPVEGGPPPEETPPPGPGRENVTTAKAVIEPVEVKQAVVPGEAKPGSGVGAVPRAPRPVGFQYYALIAQQPLAPILAEARRVTRQHTDIEIQYMPERSVAGVLAFAGATEASPVSADGTPRAQAVSPRPANLWDILNDSGTPTVMSGATVVVQPATSAKTVVTERPAAPIKTALAERPATPAPATKTAARPTAPALMPMTKVSGQEPPVARREIPMTPAYLPSFNPMEMTNKPAAPTAAPAKLPEAMPTPILKTPEPQMPSPAALKMPDISALPAGPPPMILTGTQGTQPKVSITTSVPAPLPVISSGAPAPAPAPNSASAPAPAASGPQVLVLPPPALPAGPKTVTMPAPIQTPAPSMLTLKAPEPTPMVVPQQPVVPARQTEAAPVRTPTPEARQALVALTGGATAQERQQAAGKVMRADLVSAPELVRHLMTAAQSDNEEPDTRVACIRALVRCQVRTPAMMAWLDGLSNDEVGPVRVEAIIGQARLRTAGSAATANPAPR